MKSFTIPCAVCSVLLLASGCSVKRIAVNQIGNALASGGSTFEGDDDPDLVGDALPFALKTMESLLAESPKHQGLLLATASGFTEYAYAFVASRAERAFTENVEEAFGHSRRVETGAGHVPTRLIVAFDPNDKGSQFAHRGLSRWSLQNHRSHSTRPRS